jgi:hypothetical protein
VLNLSIFESFFPEKRPFFLEDSRIFVLPYPQVQDFYSRRIGQTPGRFALQENETLVRKPDNTTIIGAAKVTGKSSGWTYGGLTALTAREYATVDVATGAPDGAELVTREERLVEPMTGYNVGRVQRDVLRGSSNVGAIATAVMQVHRHRYEPEFHQFLVNGSKTPTQTATARKTMCTDGCAGTSSTSRDARRTRSAAT